MHACMHACSINLGDQSGAFPLLEMRKIIPWRHNMAALNSPEGTLPEFFNSHFFESSQFTLPSFHYTTTKKAWKKRQARDCGIWRWNTRGGKVLLSIHMTPTPGFGIAWSAAWGNVTFASRGVDPAQSKSVFPAPGSGDSRLDSGHHRFCLSLVRGW